MAERKTAARKSSTTTRKASSTKGSTTARAKTTSRASTSTRTKSGTTRARSAALAKSAPTVRMRVDDRDLQPTRQPGSADILAVALVVFMCVLAACNTQLTGKGGPRSHAPTPAIVAQA